MAFSNRDIASLVWLAAVVGFVPWRRDTREAVVAALRILWGKLAVLIAVFALYIGLVVLGGQSLGIWNLALLKETVAWWLVPGMVLLFGFTKAYEGRGSYGRTLLRVIGLTALI